MSKDIRAEIFLGCYGFYNEGRLLDKRYTLVDALKDFEVYVLKTVRKDKTKKEIETYINDEFIDLGTGESISEVREFFEIAKITGFNKTSIWLYMDNVSRTPFNFIKKLFY